MVPALAQPGQVHGLSKHAQFAFWSVSHQSALQHPHHGSPQQNLWRLFPGLNLVCTNWIWDTPHQKPSTPWMEGYCENVPALEPSHVCVALPSRYACTCAAILVNMCVSRSICKWFTLKVCKHTIHLEGMHAYIYIYIHIYIYIYDVPSRYACTSSHISFCFSLLHTTPLKQHTVHRCSMIAWLPHFIHTELAKAHMCPTRCYVACCCYICTIIYDIFHISSNQS